MGNASALRICVFVTPGTRAVIAVAANAPSELIGWSCNVALRIFSLTTLVFTLTLSYHPCLDSTFIIATLRKH